MNLSRFIALRIYRNSEPGKQVSRPAVLIAMVGIALGLAVDHNFLVIKKDDVNIEGILNAILHYRPSVSVR